MKQGLKLWALIVIILFAALGLMSALTLCNSYLAYFIAYFVIPIPTGYIVRYIYRKKIKPWSDSSKEAKLNSHKILISLTILVCVLFIVYLTMGIFIFHIPLLKL